MGEWNKVAGLVGNPSTAMYKKQQDFFFFLASVQGDFTRIGGRNKDDLLVIGQRESGNVHTFFNCFYLSTTATTATKTGTDRIYSDFDLAVAPTTCSGGENEDLRLGFCPYDRIFLISATTMDDVPVTLTSESTTSDLSNIRADDDDAKRRPSYLSILIVESTRSEWQRANADLRRVRGSFIVT